MDSLTQHPLAPAFAAGLLGAASAALIGAALVLIWRNGWRARYAVLFGLALLGIVGAVTLARSRRGAAVQPPVDLPAIPIPAPPQKPVTGREKPGATPSKRKPPAKPRIDTTPDGAGGETPDPDELPPTPGGAAPWFDYAQTQIGTREIRGSRHSADVLAYFRDAGFAGIKNDETSWCAAFVGACLKRTGFPAMPSLTARDYLRYGVECEPMPGAIVVFWRESRSSWKGHVGFVHHVTASHVYCLGGNQSDAVNIQRFELNRVLGYRWPRNAAQSKIVKASSLNTTLGLLAPVAAVSPYPWLALAIPVAMALISLYVAWQRRSDLQTKGV